MGIVTFRSRCLFFWGGVRGGGGINSFHVLTKRNSSWFLQPFFFVLLSCKWFFCLSFVALRAQTELEMKLASSEAAARRRAETLSLEKRKVCEQHFETPGFPNYEQLGFLCVVLEEKHMKSDNMFVLTFGWGSTTCGGRVVVLNERGSHPNVCTR